MVAPAAAATDYAATPTVPADQGLQLLIDGNKRFVAGNLTSLSNLAQDREELATGQSPFAVIVCCSDSRVPPELVFDQTLGQLFVVRTAGQVIDEAARSSIVYGVDYLKAPLLLVLGHSGCGAVEAALAAIRATRFPGTPTGLPKGSVPPCRVCSTSRAINWTTRSGPISQWASSSCEPPNRFWPPLSAAVSSRSPAATTISRPVR